MQDRCDAWTGVRKSNFVFDLDPAPGDQDRVRLPHPEILRSLKPGHTNTTGGGMVQGGMAKRACKLAGREGFAKAHDRIIIVAGVPFGTPGATNVIRIAVLDADSK